MAAPLNVSVASDFYEVKWESGMLGLRFTPNEKDEAVVCQIANEATEEVKKSRVAVGDVVVAVEVHSIGAPMTPMSSLNELVQVFQTQDLPITVRFRSRQNHLPERIELIDIARSYTYAWPLGQPLGVSLAMDPCTLHTIITYVDPDRISPELKAMDPQPGDILVSVRNGEQKADLDAMRFSKAVECLKTFARPSKLTFVRLHEESTSPQHSPRNQMQNIPRSAPSNQAPPSPSCAPPPPPFSEPRSPANLPHRPRPAPLMKRQSFAVNQPKQPEKLSEEDAKRKARREARFYKIVYNGGRLGIVLKDANEDLNGTPKKNGYYVSIKKIQDKHAVEGLEQANEGDELIAIGRRDLQHMTFEDVQKELSQIREPTPLIFQRRPPGNVSIGAALANGLVLLMI